MPAAKMTAGFSFPANSSRGVSQALNKTRRSLRFSNERNANMENSSQQKAPIGLILAAYLAVYIIYGSTYLGIKYAIETIPPLLMGGARFLIAGAVLYGILRAKGIPVPGASHWRNAAVVGALLLGVGNGGVILAEQTVPSGLASLMIAMVPLWFALFDWVRPGGIRPTIQTVLGIAVGFAGVGLLVSSRGPLLEHMIDPAGAMMLTIASLSWAAGSLYARYTPKPTSPLMGIALQMIAGGALLFIVGLIVGEAPRFSLAQTSIRSGVAFAYLTVFGSLVGFTAYSWLLKVGTPARIATYAYVNPIVAVFLGWAIAGENFESNTILAASIILLGVIIITTQRIRRFESKKPKESIDQSEAPFPQPLPRR